MYNRATTKMIESMKELAPMIGTDAAARILGISPKGFKRYLENCKTLPDYAIEVTDEGTCRTFRIFTERFATFLCCGEATVAVEEDGIGNGNVVGFRPELN